MNWLTSGFREGLFWRRSTVVLLCGALVSATSSIAASPESGDGCDEVGCVEHHREDDDTWREPNRGRTAISLAALVGGGAAWYWIDRERQVADWDFPSLKDRLSTDIFINDHNPFAINYAWHSIGGSAFHLAGRSNDLGMIESALFATAASLTWEYGVEYREKISINDIIFTSGAGLALGEFTHWLGRLLQYPGGTGWRVARWTLGLPQSANDALDGRRGPRGPEIWHRFRAGYGLGYAGGSRRDGGEEALGTHLHHVRIGAELAALDHYLRPGSNRRGFRDGNLTSLRAELVAGPEGTGIDTFVDTMLVGWRARELGEEEDDVRTGTALNVGAAIGVRYRHQGVGIWNDRLGVLHLPGLGVDADVLGEGWMVRNRLRAHVDYAGVGALSSDRWHEANPDETGKSVLELEGYYYGWGWSGSARSELQVRGLGLGGEVFYGRYWSQEGLDRDQELVTIDQRADDRVIDWALWLRAALRRSWFVELRTSGHLRKARLEDLQARASLDRHSIEIGAWF